MTGVRERRWAPNWQINLASTLSPLSRGHADPTMRIGPDGVWRATRTPAGPATVHYSTVGQQVHIRAWGPGAEIELDGAPELLGADDDPTGFAAAAHPVMAAAHARFGAGWRVLRTQRVLEALVPAILEQRVTSIEARRSWARLIGAHGEPAPGPGRAAPNRAAPGPDATVPASAARVCGGQPGDAPPALIVAPDASGWLGVPSWSWHQAGVDPGRAATIMKAAGRRDALERLSQCPPAQAGGALQSLPGIGRWTAAEVGVRAWGDRDAVSFGDFHLARMVVHALTGRADGTDEQMADLLTPWAGQRARAVALLGMHAHGPARRTPRAAIPDHRSR